jgi:hypothetical protein
VFLARVSGVCFWRGSEPDSMVRRFFYERVSINKVLSKPVNNPQVLLMNFQL